MSLVTYSALFFRLFDFCGGVAIWRISALELQRVFVGFQTKIFGPDFSTVFSARRFRHRFRPRVFGPYFSPEFGTGLSPEFQNRVQLKVFGAVLNLDKRRITSDFTRSANHSRSCGSINVTRQKINAHSNTGKLIVKSIPRCRHNALNST